MSNALEKLEQAALLGMMVTAGDTGGVSMLLEVLAEAAQAATEAEGRTILLDELKKLEATRPSTDAAEFLNKTLEFISSSQATLRNPGAAVHSEMGNTDVAPNCDQELLSDFIEKYQTLPEDLEAALVSYATDGGASRDQTFAILKAYFHTLKGDAGAVGLIGFERATHSVESSLEDLPSELVRDWTLEFHTWMTKCFQELAGGDPFSELSDAFLARLATLKPASAPSNPVQTAPVQASPASATPSEPTEEDPLKKFLMATPPAREESYQLSGDASILNEFLAEAEEHLTTAEEVLLEGASNYDKESIDKIFRAVHSIKGGSAYFGLLEITEISHVTETMMDAVRIGKLDFTPAMQSLLLEYTETMKGLFAQTRTAMSGDGTIVRSSNATKFGAKVEDHVRCLSILGELEIELSAISKPISQKPVAAAPVVQKPIEVVESVAAPRAVKEPVEEVEEKLARNGAKLEIKSFVKVDTERLDKLIDSIGEMVIYSSMLVRTCRDHLADNEFVIRTCHQVETFSRDLQEVGMAMRLVPVKGLFQKLSRVVWDTGKRLGKEINFRSVGEDTELDRTLVETLADPLMHMVRNAVDHGIETTPERLANGKSPNGSVELRAYHLGGSIFIEICDDGKGLNPEMLYQKAVEKGIVAPGQRLSQQEAFQLIFAPGFSTAAAVTDISGRGVGMDVVRRNIESVRGRVHIESEVGKGSVFRIEVPLTLAIMEGIEVRVGEQRFILPTLSTLEFVCPQRSQIQTTLSDWETFMFRGKYLPVYRVSELLNVEGAETDPTKAVLVIVETKGEHFALMVDRVIGQHSAVIKNLGDLYQSCPAVAGCAIMSDGQAALILDVSSALTLARERVLSRSAAAAQAPVESVH